MALAAPLETELQVFEEHRQVWSLAHLGEYVVIQDGRVWISSLTHYEDALPGRIAGVWCQAELSRQANLDN